MRSPADTSDGSNGLDSAVADANIADPGFVDRQIKTIEAGLTRVLFGDYTSTIQMEEGGPLWGNLAMHINVAINAARNAIHRAQHSEEIAAQARDEALAAARAESQFLTNVSHELRTPLASIRAAAEILKSYPDESTATRLEFSSIILEESERLSRLIEDVLDLSKIQSRRQRWDFRELQVGFILSEVVRNFSLTRSTRAADVRLTIVQELPMTYGDRDRLKQLWTNLIDNAIKFSSEGDTVVVRALRDGDAILVEVRDFGVGIRKEDQKMIFSRFRQATRDTLTEKPQGTGLGLAICEEIVAFHGGEILLESEPGRGSTFRVRLPVQTKKELEALEARLGREE